MDIPGAVAHCMDKFTLNKGLSHSAVFAVFLYPLGIRIHPAHHIQHGNIVVITCGIVDACFIMQQTGRIISLYPSSGVLKVAAVAALIAQGPENNRALVFVPNHISLLTVEDRLRPGIILRDVARVRHLYTKFLRRGFPDPLPRSCKNHIRCTMPGNKAHSDNGWYGLR